MVNKVAPAFFVVDGANGPILSETKFFTLASANSNRNHQLEKELFEGRVCVLMGEVVGRVTVNGVQSTITDNYDILTPR